MNSDIDSRGSTHDDVGRISIRFGPSDNSLLEGEVVKSIGWL